MEAKRHKKIPKDKRAAIENNLKEVLEKHPKISFAYLHGSFIKDEGFGDIDVAVYLKDIPPSPLDYELKLETELMDAVGCYTVDVRVLNMAPLSFKYNVIKDGVLLIVRDDELRAQFQETTLINYFDFAPYRNNYLKETLGVGVQ